MSKKNRLPLITLLLFLPWSASAADWLNTDWLEGDWYGATMLSYIEDDVDRDADDGISGYTLGLGKDLNTNSSIEFNAIGNFFNADGFDADQVQWGLGVDYIRRLGRIRYFVPYGVAGGGFIKSLNDDPFVPDGSGLIASVGVGVLRPLSLFDLDLRTELRIRADYSVDSRRDLLFSIGLQRAINRKTQLPGDNDSDGVADLVDLCNNTPRNVDVDFDGCASFQNKNREPFRWLDDNWYIANLLSFIDDDGDRDVDDKLSGYSLIFGKDLNTNSSVEFSAIANFYKADGFDADQRQWGVGVDYFRRFGKIETFVPYAVVGAGHIKSLNDDPFKPDGSGLMTSVGAGFLTPLNVFDLDLRTEVRLRTDHSVGRRQDLLFSIGVQRAFNPKPPVAGDSDQDGVIDTSDLCRKTPTDMPVDVSGCARFQDEDTNPRDLLADGWYATTMLSLIDDDTGRFVSDGHSGLHIGVGKNLSSASSLEFNGILAFFTDDDGTSDQKQWGLGVDYIRRFGNIEHFVPYAIIGAGIIETQVNNLATKDGRGTMTSIGLGVLTPLRKFDLMLRTELRFRTDRSVRTLQDYVLSVGLQRAIKPKPVLLIDTDRDGVVDSNDRCGDTPQNIVVDRYGCARTQDGDYDGVPDNRDMCGGTPPGSDVDEYGCNRSEQNNN